MNRCPAFALALRLGAALCLLAALPALLRAQEPGIRCALGREGPFWIGERIPLRIELLSPTWFAGATSFELPEIPGGILLRVDERPTVLSEMIGEDTYSVQRHELALFVQREGTCEVPPIQARFGIAGKPGEGPVDETLSTTALSVELRRPPGTEGLAYVISTTELAVEGSWDPEPGAATVGDAVTRRITRRAPDLPAMSFPPLPALETPGLAAYPKQPVVRDRTERGEFTGEREDAITYVCERAGTSSVPALAITWWDTDDEVLRREVIEGVSFDVAPAKVEPLAGELDAATGGEGPSLRWLLGFGLLLAVAAFGAWKRASLAVWAAHRRERRDATEAGRFARLRRACRRGDASATLGALYAWLGVAWGTGRAPTLGELVERAPDAELSRALGALQEAVLARGPLPARGELEGALRRARVRLRREARTAGPLPPLNPTS